MQRYSQILHDDELSVVSPPQTRFTDHPEVGKRFTPPPPCPVS